ncbi:hypothetical protein NL676_006721 [Syzygium grande]|nr:hypothetical protein NL676_006721 [Syzygium grande]
MVVWNYNGEELKRTATNLAVRGGGVGAAIGVAGGLEGGIANDAEVKIRTAVVFSVESKSVGVGATAEAGLFKWGCHGSAAEDSNVVTETESSATLDCRQGNSVESWSWKNSVVAVETHTRGRGRLLSPLLVSSSILLYVVRAKRESPSHDLSVFVCLIAL